MSRYFCFALLIFIVAHTNGDACAQSVAAPSSPTAEAVNTAVTLKDLPTALLLPLPKLSEAQVRELVSDLATQYQLTEGFDARALTRTLVGVPSDVKAITQMSREGGGRREIVILGYALLPRRLPQLWVLGWMEDGNARVPSPLVGSGELAKTVQLLVAERTKLFARLALSELESRVINLSYVDADAALFALRAMGYAAITDTEALARDDSFKSGDLGADSKQSLAPEPTRENTSPFAGLSNIQGMTADDFRRLLPKFPAIKNLPSAIAFDRLPLVVRMPATDSRNMGLVGGETNANNNASNAGRDQLGLSMIPQAAANLNETVTGGTAQLLVMFHPAYPEQFQKLRRIVQTTIDRPARQVFVEGLVLEVSSDSLAELGVKWDLKKGTQSFSIGTLNTAVSGDSAFSALRDGVASVTPTQMMARINALVQANKAEILSRPSVLTLDNRQATIRVGTDIPVATSKDASSAGQGSSRVAFSFQYIPTGILMNVRPRVSEDGSEISMLIDATVSATVPNQDLKVLDPATRVTLASAPTISTRRVQTYARIRDNMPLIIGGLVSKDHISGTDKVPLMGEIPILGKLFGHEARQDRKREVIIVLTPSVVTENVRETKAQYPRDDERFDLVDTTLFKEHYRIRAEDLVDSSYIRFNRRFVAFRDAATRLIERNSAQATNPVVDAFTAGKVPGEFIFVSGMMYRMLDRLRADEPIRIENITTFERTSTSELRPISLQQLLARYGDGSNPDSFFSGGAKRALALRFTLSRQSLSAADLFAEPVPEVFLVDCPDRATWRQKMWELNSPAKKNSLPQFTILIHDRTDLRRLQLAFATQNTILNNGGASAMVFDKWLPGRMLHLQEVSPNWERILLAPIAQYFFIGEFAMPYFMREHEAAMQKLEPFIDPKDLAALSPSK